MKRNSPNQHLQRLIEELKSKSLAEGVGLWKSVARNLEKPSRQRRSVNLYRIEEHLQEGELALVPGKVLGTGDLSKPVTVAAFSFSAEAQKKIAEKKGKILTIQQLMEQNPKGKGVRVLG